MKTTLRDVYRVKDLVRKIQNRSRKEGLRLIYEWAITDRINFGVFRYLTSVLPMTEDSSEHIALETFKTRETDGDN